jgi:hypothetical protein
MDPSIWPYRLEMDIESVFYFRSSRQTDLLRRFRAYFLLLKGWEAW